METQKNLDPLTQTEPKVLQFGWCPTCRAAVRPFKHSFNLTTGTTISYCPFCDTQLEPLSGEKVYLKQ